MLSLYLWVPNEIARCHMVGSEYDTEIEIDSIHAFGRCVTLRHIVNRPILVPRSFPLFSEKY